MEVLAMLIHIYGPGGPYPAMNYVAKEFNKYQNKCRAVVKAGPLPVWKKEALKNGDIIYSGSEDMMEDFLRKLPNIDKSSIKPVYYRPSAIIYRDITIKSFKDLAKPGVKILVVNGAGQVGLWQDMAMKYGNFELLKAIEKNISHISYNSKDALEYWNTHKNVNAFIIYNIWAIAHHIKDYYIPKRHVIYRDMDISLTYKGDKNPCAKEFYNYVIEAKQAFKYFGWSY
jgi:Accessory colonization factor AcfC, contains ABC-type periplasmic domain